MFRQSPPPGDDTQTGPAMSVPEVPPARKFVLKRMNPEPYSSVVEEIVIFAHEVEVNQTGTFVRFREFMIHPTEGPTNRVVRAFNGYLDYEEIIIERPAVVLASSFPGIIN